MRRVGSGVRRPSTRRPEIRFSRMAPLDGPPPPSPDQAQYGRGSGLSLAAPLPAIRNRSDHASLPTTGNRASLASSRFAKVRDRQGARVSSAQGARAIGDMSQGTVFTYPEPWRFREASGNIVSVAPPRMCPSGFPDASFFRFIRIRLKNYLPPKHR